MKPAGGNLLQFNSQSATPHRMRRGFTLVELSIVLVIIGLLIGGILVAQSMISTAKILRLNKEIGEVEILVNMFKQQYQMLPGDIQGYKYFAGGQFCTSTSLCDGNANGSIDGTEGRKALAHLALAGFIPMKSYDPATSGSNFIVPHNAKTTMIPSSFGNEVGMYLSATTNPGITSADCTGTSDYRRANYIGLSKIDSTSTVTTTAYNGYREPDAFISHVDYAALDKKFDDGKPRAGKYWAYGNGGEYLSRYACTVGYNTCPLSGPWRTSGGWWIHTGEFSKTVPVCGVLYWYDIY